MSYPLYIRADTERQAFILCDRVKSIAKILKGRDFAILIPDGTIVICYPFWRAPWIRAEYCLGVDQVSARSVLAGSEVLPDYIDSLADT